MFVRRGTIFTIQTYILIKRARKAAVSAFLLAAIIGPSLALSQVNPIQTHEVSYSRDSMADILASEENGDISKKRLKLNGRLGLGGATFATEDSDSTASILKLRIDGDYRFADKLSTHLELQASFLSERSQETYGDASLENGFRLKHATVDWNPSPWVRFSAGAVKQGYVANSDLLIDSDVTFPAVVEWVRVGNSTIALELMAEQAIPTSRSLDFERQEKEEMPSFFLEKLTLDYVPSENFQFRPYIGHFKYSQLPSKVAFQSNLYGNTVIQGFESSSLFKYSYEGFTGGIEALVRFNERLSLVGFYSEVRNTQAPSAFNTGREIGFKVQTTINRVEVTPIFTSRFNESDASPAYYNSAEWGGNNMEGYSAALWLGFKKHKFNLFVEYHDSKVINPHRVLRDSQLLFVGLETFNVNFF